jgi:cytochrome P450
LVKGPYYSQFNSIEGVGNLFTEQDRELHHHYKSTSSSIFSRRNVAKMEAMITSKYDMLRDYLQGKADAGKRVDVLAAVRSISTDVISSSFVFETDKIAELFYGTSLNLSQSAIENNDLVEMMDTATSNWSQLASHFPFLISIMSKIPVPILKRFDIITSS